MKCSECDASVEQGAEACPLGHPRQDRAPVSTLVWEQALLPSPVPAWAVETRVADDLRDSSSTTAGRPPDAVSTRRRISRRWRVVIAGVGGLAAAALIVAGVLSDVGTRRSLDAANSRLGTQSQQLSTQADELQRLRDKATLDQATIAAQQAQVAGAAQREAELEACTGSLATFLQDLADRQEVTIERDYRAAFSACQAASVELPLP
ncbi:MAG TPA: hypothetical protein VFO60_06890 [Candidatus Dormibacteraeota bacterium]|nr:hypothetical protein [Candidatus Dormibacteraeota bacterium]